MIPKSIEASHPIPQIIEPSINALPPEILGLILDKIPPIDFFFTNQVCRIWHSISQDFLFSDVYAKICKVLRAHTFYVRGKNGQLDPDKIVSDKNIIKAQALLCAQKKCIYKGYFLRNPQNKLELKISILPQEEFQNRFPDKTQSFYRPPKGLKPCFIIKELLTDEHQTTSKSVKRYTLKFMPAAEVSLSLKLKERIIKTVEEANFALAQVGNYYVYVDRVIQETLDRFDL